MVVLVMPLPGFSVIDPRLRYTQANLMLWVHRLSEILRDTVLNKITQLGELSLPQYEVIRACGIAHIGPRWLINNKVYFGLR
jgi:hypothetical protein